LERKTKRLTQPIKEAIASKGIRACLNECGSMFSLFFGLSEVKSKEDLANLDQQLFIRLFRFLFEKGIYLPPSSHEAWFVSAAHTDAQLDATSQAVVDFIKNL
jgi:glutamate-1-semialdehyde 2,1-aminomutase